MRTAGTTAPGDGGGNVKPKGIGIAGKGERRPAEQFEPVDPRPRQRMASERCDRAFMLRPVEEDRVSVPPLFGETHVLAVKGFA